MMKVELILIGERSYNKYLGQSEKLDWNLKGASCLVAALRVKHMFLPSLRASASDLCFVQSLVLHFAPGWLRCPLDR